MFISPDSILESRKSKIVVPADLVSENGPLPGGRDRSSLSSLFLIRALIASRGLHPDDLIASQGLTAKYHHTGIRVSTRILKVYKHSVQFSSVQSLSRV